jgi:hypothetical protein
MWGQIYQVLAKEDIPGEEILRIAATIYYGPGQGKPRPSDESLELLRNECKTPTSPSQISERLLGVAQQLAELYANVQLNAVTDILQARLLAVALKSAQGVNEQEREKLLSQWERVTFRIFGLFGKDARTKVGDYVKLAFRIVTNHIEARTYNQIMAALREIGREYPAEDAVKEGLAGKDFYESPDACRYLLWNYEEHLAQNAGSGATYDEQERSAIWKLRAVDSIEHIFPQNPAAKSNWNSKMRRGKDSIQPIPQHVGRIGNLLLLPGALNGEATTRPFGEKKSIYKKHNLRLIQEVLGKKDWTLLEIEEREARISRWAEQRWSDI